MIATGARIGAVSGFLLCELAALLAGVDPSTALLRALAALAGGSVLGAGLAMAWSVEVAAPEATSSGGAAAGDDR